MREIRPSGSEGGGGQANALSLPLSASPAEPARTFAVSARGCNQSKVQNRILWAPAFDRRSVI